MRAREGLCFVSIFAAMAALPRVASAHDVTVDGNTAEWSSRTPPPGVTNLALVVRTIDPAGELVWSDAPGDTRTDLSAPGPEIPADLSRFAVTSSAAGLHFLVVVGPDPIGGDPTQVQIAIDLDRTSGSGEANFGGFADTTVAADAEWEFLVQTQRTGGAPSVRVLSTAFAQVGTGTIDQAATGAMEITIPWAALSRTGPPAAMRLTVATFREDTSTGNTRAIGDASISNALDALTNYGGPARTGNTWDEVMDGDVDHHLDVFFDTTSGEVVAPLLVARFASNTAGSAEPDEWLAIFNQTGSALSLAGVKVGDEETIRTSNGAEAMLSFPAGSTIAAGDTIVIARRAMVFATSFGAPPDYEMEASDPAVPDLTPYLAWFTGTPGAAGLGNGADEILVVDARDTIVDVVTWGTSNAFGVAALSPPMEGQVAIRGPATRDTDDTATDFSSVVATCDRAEPATCGGCYECAALFSCEVRAAGTACPDADLCDGEETCDATGNCLDATTPLECDDSNPCTDDACVAATGCDHDPASAGTACADADLCDGAEACDAAGNCVAGTPVDCSDDDLCTDDVCAPATGACTNPLAAAGATCADEDRCDGDETCAASGACVAGTPLTCEDTSPCTTSACDPATGCTTEPVAAGVACDDGNGCTTGDACDAEGTCVGIPGETCDAGATDEDAAVTDDASVGSDAGRRDGGAADGGGSVDGDEGCSCRAAGARGRGEARAALGLLAALGLAIAMRRRRAHHG
ncbi:lamin tail domain-containing protein [Sandaracinus amylolyticus]|uniref:lamin tail domain-containing protein n=1 Tax=Sandaracinus amylolyticus TaxID=927083 RepID=UPI001F2230B4|nr:lamin tail domain-containing protein [Sandaracinus amylolyticus]UJR82026.1 LTD domain-containing protein [Sandaracinus amylolyticus]